MTSKIFLALLVLSTTACASLPHPSVGGGTPGPGTPPMSSAPHAAQGMPQSANSLPPGALVNAPLVARTGLLKTTRVW